MESKQQCLLQKREEIEKEAEGRRGGSRQKHKTKQRVEAEDCAAPFW